MRLGGDGLRGARAVVEAGSKAAMVATAVNLAEA